ncbi:hypothetical protein D3C84_874030 [compost metagenome]
MIGAAPSVALAAVASASSSRVRIKAVRVASAGASGPVKYSSLSAAVTSAAKAVNIGSAGCAPIPAGVGGCSESYTSHHTLPWGVALANTFRHAMTPLLLS